MRLLVPLVGAAAGLLCSTAGAGEGMIVQHWSAGDGSAHPRTIEVVPAGGGAVIQVDLKGLPRGARIVRARLCVRRGPGGAADPKPCQVFPFAAPFEWPKPPRLAGAPLATLPPRHDGFDATDLVRRCSAGGAGRLDLYVKRLPAWLPEKTRLEIAYLGRAWKVPQQVAGLKVLHRAGQTFLTWDEVRPMLSAEKVTWGGIRRCLARADEAFGYRIYTHDRPITAETIRSARLLARVGPLSGYNANGRNVERLIGAAMIEPDEIGELAREKNRLIETWHMDHPRMDRCPVRRFAIPSAAGAEAGKPAPPPERLAVGTGLYVHSPAEAGQRYYAVVSCLGGTENTVDFSPANSLAQPLAETVGTGEPVCQGPGLWGPFFDYPGKRTVYVQWASPPLAPRPNMYFNWSVLIPPERSAAPAAPARPPVGTGEPPADGGELAPVELYFHWANRSCARPRRKLLLGSVQIAPHDWPFSGWYGYNSTAGTLAGADRYVGDHTHKRILAFLAWAEKALPIDADRVFATGGEGAALMALHHPEVFAGLFLEGFQAELLDPAAEGKFAAAWGPRSAEIRDPHDRTAWAWAELDKLVLADPAKPLPLFVCRGYSWGRASTEWGRGDGRFYQALHKARQAVVADWSWAGGRLMAPDKRSGRWRGVKLTRSAPLPALSGSSLDSDKEANGQTNAAYSWKDVADGPEELAITLVNHSRDAAVDLTPRRLRAFRPRPGEKLRWETRNVPPARRRAATLPADRGTVTVGADGLFTLPGLKIPAQTELIVRIRRAK